MSKVDVKVVILGQHDVGKTCLVERYLLGKFKANVTATVGAAFGAKKVDVDGTSVTLGIWDTAGAERYESMSRIYYRSARAAIVCYDLTNKASFNKVRFWVEELLASEKNCEIYLVGTKADRVSEGEEARAISAATVENYASNINAKVLETSAKTGQNVDQLFNTIAHDYVAKYGTEVVKQKNVQLDDNRPQASRVQTQPEGGGCCS
eukprot:CAMPEP_0177649168 /NCGR_PEP_ID=MMETSP0447-20121125/11225_1 /TAXON_ID=0 /ORGANISM="Stygamoeba regulata, Strain BSH-02190019" /LENGTH=206 /DNA_ID=CAMNT_0019151873 /DNA_START=256 /DNA_END=876 /DNA_ORIENTATION=-